MDTIQLSHLRLSYIDDPATPVADDVCRARHVPPTRGIGWVLKWAVATAALFYSATVLTEFAYSLTAERMLARAARAGVLEATLPRATLKSVNDSVRRRLDSSVASPADLKLILSANGSSVQNKLQPRGGDRLALTLAMPARALMPNWFRTLTYWRGDTTIEARAERTVPGRRLVTDSKTGG